MNNIFREFLYTSNEKFVPVQLLRSNYGTVEVGDTPRELVDDQSNNKQFTVRFPYNSSCIAFLIELGQVEKIVQVASAPPGVSSVELNYNDNKSYWIYVISREFEDGYISEEITIPRDQNSYTKFVLDSETDIEVADLSQDGRLIASVDETDITQWFNFQGWYDGPLVWSTELSKEIVFENAYLIDYRDTLQELVDIFENNTTTNNSHEDSMKLLRVHDELVKYARKMEINSNALSDQQYDLMQFIQNNTNENYVNPIGSDLDFESHDVLDRMITCYAFGTASDAETKHWNNQSLFEHNTRNTSRTLDPYDGYMVAVKSDCNDSNLYNEYTPTFDNAISTFSMLKGHIGFPVAGDYNFDAWWNAGGDGNDDDGHIARRLIGSSMATELKTEIDYCNARLQRMGIPTITRVDDNGRFITLQPLMDVVESVSNNIIENVYPYIVGELQQVEQTALEIGDSLLASYATSQATLPTTSTTISSSYTETVYGPFLFSNSSTMPEWFNPPATFVTTETLSLQGEVLETSTAQLTNYELWQRIRVHLPSTNAQVWVDGLIQQDLSSYYNTNSNTGFGILSRDSDWSGVNQYISENLSQFYNIEYIDRIEEITITGYTTGSTFNNSGATQFDDGTEYTAQLAILQNITYLKNLINSIDENLWSSFNSTSAVILATLIDLKDQSEQNPESVSVLNITNSTVDNSDVEVLWKKVGPYSSNLERAGRFAQDWNVLDTMMFDLKDGVKVLNLNVDQFKEAGKYIIMMRPKKVEVNIESISDQYIIVKDELNDFQERNSLYGYNAQIYTSTRNKVGSQKIVSSSAWAASNQYLKLSPSILENEISVGYKVELWSNAFIPVMIEIDIVEHNSLTLSYEAYAKKEIDTNTGVCTIYDHNGNVYKRLSFGRHSNASTGNAIIEYRVPADRSYTDEY